jgi:PAS domain S-box-containing protein
MFKRKTESENGSAGPARRRKDTAKYFLASIVESSKDSIVTVDFESVITSWNKAAEHLYGYPAAEAIGKPLTMLTLPENLKQTLANTKKIQNGEAVELFETVRMNKDGRELHLEIVLSPVKDEAGQVIGVSTFARDMTARILTEQRLRKSEERFRAMFEQASVGIVMKTIEGQLMNPNPGFCQIIGYSREETVQLTLRDITHPEDYKNEVKLTRRLIKGEIPDFSMEKRYVRNDGSFIWANITATLIRQISGEPFYMLAIVEDIHERKEFEEALRKSQERLSLLIESASDYAIFTMTPDNRINSWNRGAEKVFRWNESEVLGKSGEIIFTPEDRAAGAPEQEINTALEYGRAPDERYHLRRDGSQFYASGVMSLLKDEDGKLQGFVKICRDMTEQVEAEKTMRDKEMLQILVRAQEDERTRIARDLHDELGQQLTALRLKLDALRKMCDVEELCDMIDETQLIARSIDNGVDFLAWELRPASLDDLGLIAALANYVREWSHHSGVTAELLASSLKKTRFTPEVETNLYRIVQEALNNTHKHAKAKYVEVMLEKRGEVIILLISDDGAGFNPKDKKSRLKGLGLIGMKERAALISGTLEIESAKGKGTTIFVRIPAASMKRRRANEK